MVRKFAPTVVVQLGFATRETRGRQRLAYHSRTRTQQSTALPWSLYERNVLCVMARSIVHYCVLRTAQALP